MHWLCYAQKEIRNVSKPFSFAFKCIFDSLCTFSLAKGGPKYIQCALKFYASAILASFSPPHSCKIKRFMYRSFLSQQSWKIIFQERSAFTLFAPRPKYFILENYNTDILKFLNRLKALGWKASMYYLEQRLRLIFVCCRVYIEDMKIDTLQQSQDEAFLALVFCLNNFRGNLQMLSKV